MNRLRCIDEYDVYMDPHHKQVATQMLCTHAKHHPDLQLMFLTPAGLSDNMKNLEKQHGKIFKIFTMPEIKRPDLA